MSDKCFVLKYVFVDLFYRIGKITFDEKTKFMISEGWVFRERSEQMALDEWLSFSKLNYQC